MHNLIDFNTHTHSVLNNDIHNSIFIVLGDDDLCQNDTCNGHGLCVPLQGIHTYRCMCVHGYSGDNCTIPPDPCIHNLCFQGLFIVI